MQFFSSLCPFEVLACQCSAEEYCPTLRISAEDRTYYAKIRIVENSYFMVVDSTTQEIDTQLYQTRGN